MRPVPVEVGGANALAVQDQHIRDAQDRRAAESRAVTQTELQREERYALAEAWTAEHLAEFNDGQGRACPWAWDAALSAGKRLRGNGAVAAEARRLHALRCPVHGRGHADPARRIADRDQLPEAASA